MSRAGQVSSFPERAQKAFPERRQKSKSAAGSRGAVNAAPFFHFIWKERSCRRYLIVVVVAAMMQFSIFKLLYPFPDFFSDSYSYIYAAGAHLDVNIWPIGYSKFLAAFHSLTHSGTALVSFQYFFLEITALYFFFSILYFYQPGKTTRIILVIFLFFNPLFLYLSNYVNSDPLFVALSLWWFTELIWIVNRPRLYQVFTQGVLVFLCFTVRNNAYIYPIIALAAFFLSRQRLVVRWAGILAGPLLILPFIIHTRQAAKQLTGTAQFSLFTGWQLANNALYMYQQIQVDSNTLPSAASRDLDRIARNFYKHTPAVFHDFLRQYTGNYFIRRPESPLKEYVWRKYNQEITYESVAAWGRASVTFNEYGSYLIKKHPLAFAQQFILLNTRNYFLPPLEKLEIYNQGEDDFSGIAQDWFGYKSSAIRVASKEAQGNLLAFFPYLFMIVNIYFIGSIVWWTARLRQNSNKKEIDAAVLLSVTFWALNFLFSVSATMIVIRYEVFPVITFLAFSLLMIEWLDKRETVSKQNPKRIDVPAGSLELSK
ncbi:MAG: hypothetical protein P4L51_05780 [Puia sp.]|nr:hypothetical protein [Puia sp.]